MTAATLQLIDINLTSQISCGSRLDSAFNWLFKKKQEPLSCRLFFFKIFAPFLILRELDVAEYDVCVVSLGSENIQSSILVSVLLKSMGVPFIIARAANELHGSTLERIGVDRVVYPESESARRTAHVGFETGVIDYMPIVPDFGISKLRPPEGMLGHTLEEAGLAGSADRHGISVLAIRRGRTSFLHPAKDEEIKAGDVLIVAATNEHLGKISEIARHLEPAPNEAHSYRNGA